MAAHHGVIERSQALRSGVTPRQIDGLLARGEWRRALPRVYVQAGTPRTWEQELAVALAWAGDDAAAGGTTAGFLHALIEERPQEITIRAPRRVRLDGVRVLRTPSWLPGGVVTVRGFRAVHPCSVLIDLAQTVDEKLLEEALHVGINRGLFSPDRVRRRVERLGTAGRRGAGTLVRLLEICPERPPESRNETRVLRILRRLGPPFPEVQYRIVLFGDAYRLDVAYPAWRKAAEADSHRHHVLRRDFERNLWKREALRRAGWDVCAVSAKLVRDAPDRAEAMLREFLHGPDRLAL